MLILNRFLLAATLVAISVTAFGDGLTGSISPQSGGGIGGFNGGISFSGTPIVVVGCPVPGGANFNTGCNLPYLIGGIFP